VLRRDFFYLHPETLKKHCSVIPKSNHAPTLLRLDNADNPVEFRTLLLPSMEVIGLETLRKVREFQQAGGNVIAVGRLPLKSAEQGKDAEVVTLLEEIFGKNVLATDRQERQRKPFRVEASSEWAAGGHSPQLAFDGNLDTRWNSVANGPNGQWLKVVFPEPVEVASVVLCEPFDRVAKFQIQTFDTGKNDWTTQAAGERINRRTELTFPAVKAKELRILFDHPGHDCISISEVDVLTVAGQSVVSEVPPTAYSHSAPNKGLVVMIHDNPILPLSRIDPFLRSLMEFTDVQFANEESLPIGTPTGSFIYLHRVIQGRDV
jgi:hypothetical protein